MYDGFTQRARKVIQLAREEAVRLNNDYVKKEHILLGLLKEGKGIAASILQNLNVDVYIVRRRINEAIVNSSGGTLTKGAIPFNSNAKKTLQIAVEEARSLGHNYIGTEHLLLGLVRDRNSLCANILNNQGVTYKVVKKEIKKILHGGPQEQGKEIKAEKNKTPMLDRFATDLTQQAKDRELDPIIGRDQEINRVIQILSRRKKNNPILIGEPGVGKTAIVEGLAQRIADEEVPELLFDQRLLIIDLPGIVAGTKYRGQFEERMKAIMKEIKNSDNILIFIDEIHTLIGAGGAEGALDASNILKPALARGDMQCVGATTLDEYRKHIEKDGALERRFQSVIVDPPTADETLEILKGLKRAYEEHHHVHYTAKSLQTAVKLASRFISDRYMPDKAIDVMDETGSKVHLSHLSTPPEVIELQAELDEICKYKSEAVEKQEYEKAAEYRDREKNILQKIDEIKHSWKEDKTDYIADVSDENIAEVVSMMTGIPVTRLDTDESKRLLNMEQDIKKRIIGQDEAIKIVSKAIRRTRSGLKDPNRPIGSFIFLGPTGVGKTELARQLAYFLFNDEEALIRIDMSEYMEKFSVSRLVGAPPGYIGYDEGGQLTEKVRRKPYSVVLLDEIEKAHQDIFNILLQVLDVGVLTDSYGRKVDFRNVILIMTSNLGARKIGKEAALGFRDFKEMDEETTYKEMKANVTGEVKKTFNPEFLNRIDEVVVFHSLTKKHILKIIDIFMDEMRERLDEKNMEIVLTRSAKEFLVEKGYDPKFGARPLKRAIQKWVEDPLSDELLKGNFHPGDVIEADAGNNRLIFRHKVEETIAREVVSTQ